MNELISRKSAKNAIYKVCLSEGNKDIFVKILDEINKLSSIEQEPKTGHWVMDNDKEHGHCDQCGYKTDLVNGDYHNFCRKCGARMVEQESEE